MRSTLGLVALVLAGLAALTSNLDSDHVARGAALIWAGAAAWVGVLLVMSVTVWQASSPPPRPEAIYVGLTATTYHLVGLYGGAAFVLAAAFAPEGWLSLFGSQRPATGEATP